MTPWRFIVTREAEMDLDGLDNQVRVRIVEKLKWFRENFDRVIPFPLGEPWKGFFKLRVGDWRIIYEVESFERMVTIHHIDRRDKIYRKRK